MSRSELLAARIRFFLLIFIFGLVASGATAIPQESELRILTGWIVRPAALAQWLARIHDALTATNAMFPFLAYGTDWLAFGHFAIAIAFWGPLRDPVKNIWVIEFGMIACLLIVPFAFGMGSLRQIPVGWRLIDCSFGLFGIIPLWVCRRDIRELARLQSG